MLLYLLCCVEVVLQHGAEVMVDLYSMFVPVDLVCLSACTDMMEEKFGDSNDKRG